MASIHVSVALGTAVLAGVYVATARALRRAVAPRQALAFAGALATVLVALDGPIDALADARLFSAHMAQHLLLGYVMPPLLLLGVPGWMLRPPLRVRPLAAVARALTHPLAAFLAYNGFLVVLHLPPVYDRMVRDGPLHVALHLGLMAAGVLGWWPLLSPLSELPRLAYPGQMLYLFLLLIPMAAVSAPIALAPTVIYPWYAAGPHPLGTAPLADQVVGGLLMWVGAGLYLMAVFSMIFFRWASRDDRDEPSVGRPAPRRAA
ncbi:MAG TPA: cytochrome c oxidase assembly protein [Candidatus Binatia bacterium]|nr:cytochrome c oxidase assembly protein [Candidatus Binatia bacterium]